MSSKPMCHKCEEKCGKGKVHPEIVQALEKGYTNLIKSDSTSLLKKYLTFEIFNKLKLKKTSFGSTLLDCVQSGLENLDSGIGLYAADPECYTVFADIFDKVIEDYHVGFKKSSVHPPLDFGNISSIGNVDPNSEYVVSTRVRCCRSLEGYPFNPCLTESQYFEIEKKVNTALSVLPGELSGTYYCLKDMGKDVQTKLIDDHFLFKEGDRFLQSANACRFWPTGRGIYYNENKTFLVWINEEDHMRIISLQPGGNLGEVYKRFTQAIIELQQRLNFMNSDHLGYLTFCPTNLGTTIRASVHIRLPKLASNKAKLDELAERYHLQVRGTRGEHTEAEGGIYDLSNKRRLGLTEFEVIKEMYDGVLAIIREEKLAK